MRLSRRLPQAEPSEPNTVVVPVVLPQVIATVDATGRACLVVDGVERPGGPPSRDELGRVLAEIADQQGGPVRVEVREPDGSRYADILQPQPRPPVPAEEQDPPAEKPVLRVEGFLAGEAVVVAVVATTIHAGPDGIASLTDPPKMTGRGGEVVLLGSASETIVRASLPAQTSQPSRWWRR